MTGALRKSMPDDEGRAATRAVIVSTVVVGCASVLEFATTRAGHSAGVLADALHNAAGVVTTLVVLVAFAAARRPSTRRFTSGFGRIEDVATLVITVVIVLTATASAFQSLGRLLSSEGYQDSLPAMGAALVAVIANLGVSEYRVRVGRRIRSVALESDGLHARLDALVSAAALAGLVLAWMGFAIADPLAGLGITIAIVYILARTISRLVLRMMDAVDPELVQEISSAAAGVNGVLGVHGVRARWVGRELVAVVHVECDAGATVAQADVIADAVERQVASRVPAVRLDVHMDPSTGSLTRAT